MGDLVLDILDFLFFSGWGDDRKFSFLKLLLILVIAAFGYFLVTGYLLQHGIAFTS